MATGDIGFLGEGDCEGYFPIPFAEPIKELEEQKYDRTVLLKGPRSPLESQVHPVLPHNGNRAVVIDGHSVNCVHLTSMQQVCTTAIKHFHLHSHFYSN